MQLLADRFVSDDGIFATDLATGDRVVLIIGSAGGESEQRRWICRCEMLQKLHHPSLARLVDYGAVGESRRFEAWQCEAAWSGPDGPAERAWDRVATLFSANGLTTGSRTPAVVRQSASRAVVLPDGDSGYAMDTTASGTAIPPLSARAIVAQERRAVAVLGELFDTALTARSRVAALWGPAGSGRHTSVNELARMARTQGYVPVSVRAASKFADRLSGRSLFLIDDGERGWGWRALLSATLASRRPHILLFVGTEEVASVDGVGLEPLTVEKLIGAVWPALTVATDANRVRRMAAHANGWPGRFARLLWEDAVETGRAPRAANRVAEQPAVYQAERSLSIVPSDTAPCARDLEELTQLRRAAESGAQLVEAGRHASGERVLRQAIGWLSRRADWAPAGDASLALARVLVQRGRVREAQIVLRSAADYCTRAGDQARLVDVSNLGGVALIELGRLAEAETVLSAAIAAGRAARDPARTAQASTNLARVLFWAGRYEEAEQTLSSIGRTEQGDRLWAAVSQLGAAVAVGRRALDMAISQSSEAVRRATALGHPRLIADTTYGAAFAHLAVGDLAAVERDVTVCVSAARALREPLHAARGRLILAEALRRSGRHRAALALLQHVSRLGSTRLPPIVRARCDLLRDALSSAGTIEDTLARHVAATGLSALALYLPVADRTRRLDASDPAIDDIIHILDICQTAEDEGSILLDVCRRLRKRVHAAAVAFTAVEGDACSLLASDGDPLDLRIAVRATTAGSTIAPHRCDDRIEAAAPVRYGGTAIGALAVRWTLGTSHDLAQVAPLLTASAAAVAPILSAAAVRRRRAPGPGTTELIGVSPAIAEVRRAVERAASAPFAVLIEGESGCGKELVARALHRCGSRRDRPFATLNCAALPDDLVEAELFGHARGAFTGAVAERPGVFEEAHAGTLFLDEVGELSLRAQAKVLRVLQDGELRRIGENSSRRIDVRVVSATNRDLRQEVARARFRLDLSYRLDVIRIAVPPLRERREDIPVLAEHIWRESAERVGSRAALATATVANLARYDWPGNVRELQNVLASLVVRSPKRGVVPPTALGPQFGERFAETSRLDAARRTFEERFVRAALARTGGRRTWAARELGVSRQGLSKLMARLGISAEEQSAGHE